MKKNEPSCSNHGSGFSTTRRTRTTTYPRAFTILRELRKKAEVELGAKFDIRGFHEVILEQGTVTLAILEERIMNYINNSLKN